MASAKKPDPSAKKPTQMGSFGLGASSKPMGSFGLGASSKPMGAFGLGASSKQMGSFGLAPPPAHKPLMSVVNHIPTDQFDRGIDKITTSPSGGGGTAFVPPLWLSQVDSTNVIVASGTVSGLTPTNVATNISISSDATWNIYMDATINSAGTPTAAAVTASTSAIPSDSSTHSYRRIGTAVRASGAITSVTPAMAWSQEFVACGRDPADPGTTPGTYYWVVS